jgi:hypothetical protein
VYDTSGERYVWNEDIPCEVNMDKVAYWMPMPKPPRKEDSE